MWQLLRKHLTFDCDFLWMTRRRNLEEAGEDNMWFALVPRQSLFIGGEHPSQYTPNKRGPWTKIGSVFHIFFIPSRLSWGGEFLQKLCVCVCVFFCLVVGSIRKKNRELTYPTKQEILEIKTHFLNHPGDMLLSREWMLMSHPNCHVRCDRWVAPQCSCF